MRRLNFSTALVMALLTLQPSQAEEAQADPIVKFLKAADNNDFSTMLNLLDAKIMDSGGSLVPSEEFISKVSTCYLRRVYNDKEAERFIAAWMCDEGKGRSRVVVARLGTLNGKVQVQIGREDRNARPAPVRTGSAFAADPKP